jgi:hypothetical protein
MPVRDAQLTFAAAGRTARDAAQRMSPRKATPIAIVATAFLAGGAVSALRQTTPPASAIVARHLVIFEDQSDSMKAVAGTIEATEQWMQAELDPLKAYGVTETTVTIGGFGVARNGANNFLNALERSAAADTDAVYLFSDFFGRGGAVDAEDEAGLAELRSVLKERRLRLYLRTVRNQPSPQLLTIAHESGGDFIGEP